jgi:hypothetical protein
VTEGGDQSVRIDPPVGAARVDRARPAFVHTARVIEQGIVEVEEYDVHAASVPQAPQNYSAIGHTRKSDAS